MFTVIRNRLSWPKKSLWFGLRILLRATEALGGAPLATFNLNLNAQVGNHIARCPFIPVVAHYFCDLGLTKSEDRKSVV